MEKMGYIISTEIEDGIEIKMLGFRQTPKGIFLCPQKCLDSYEKVHAMWAD